MAHHHLRARAAQPVGDLGVHEHVDRTVGVGRAVRPGRSPRRSPAYVPGRRRASRRGRRRWRAPPPRRGGVQSGRTRCTTSMPRAARPATASASPAGPSTITRRRPAGETTDSGPRSHSGRRPRVACGRPEAGDAQPVAVGREAHHDVAARRRGVEAAEAPGQLGHAAPRAVGGDGAHLVDVARVDAARSSEPDVGRDARQQLVRGGVIRAGASSRQRLRVTCLDRLDERSQRGRCLRRTRPRRRRSAEVRTSCRADPRQDDDDQRRPRGTAKGRPPTGVDDRPSMSAGQPGRTAPTYGIE